jgi:hypothetical protein
MVLVGTGCLASCLLEDQPLRSEEQGQAPFIRSVQV